METLNFKTDILNDQGVEAVTPFLNDLKHVDGWNIDLHEPDKILTVQTTDNRIAPQIEDAVSRAGFNAEPIARP